MQKRWLMNWRSSSSRNSSSKINNAQPRTVLTVRKHQSFMVSWQQSPSHSERAPNIEEIAWAADHWRDDREKLTYIYHPAFGQPICKQTSGEFDAGNDGWGKLIPEQIEVIGDTFWFVNRAPCFGFHYNTSNMTKVDKAAVRVMRGLEWLDKLDTFQTCQQCHQK